MIYRLWVLPKIVAGFLLLIVGGLLALPGIPGPGIVIMVLGIWLLSDHFKWAKKLLNWIKEKRERFRGRGGQHPSTTEEDRSRASTKSRDQKEAYRERLP
jgi:hypothetical protein